MVKLFRWEFENKEWAHGEKREANTGNYKKEKPS